MCRVARWAEHRRDCHVETRFGSAWNGDAWRWVARDMCCGHSCFKLWLTCVFASRHAMFFTAHSEPYIIFSEGPPPLTCALVLLEPFSIGKESDVRWSA